MGAYREYCTATPPTDRGTSQPPEPLEEGSAGETLNRNRQSRAPGLLAWTAHQRFETVCEPLWMYLCIPYLHTLTGRSRA
jgi:hypothetical protein